MTTVAQLGRRKVAVNLLDCHAIARCKVLQLCNHLAVGEVLHLTTPQLGHARELQVLDADDVVLTAQLVRLFPLPVIALVGDVLFHAVLCTSCQLPVVAAIHTARHTAVGLLLGVHALFKETRRLDALAVGESHVRLQSEVDAHGCTIMCLSDRLSLGFDTEDDVVFSERRPLNGHGLYLSNSHVWTGERELVAFLDFVDGQYVSVQRIAALLKDKRREPVGFLELWRSQLDVFEEAGIGLVEPFQYLLHGLRVKAAALAKPTYPLVLKPYQVDVLVIHSVVPLLQGQRMIPHPSSLAQHRVEVLGLLGGIELVLVGYHTLVSNMGLHVRVAMVDIARPPGRFRYPTLYSPNGVRSICLADTTNATMYGGIDVPQYRLSTAKYGRNSHTRKYSFRKLQRKCYIT